MKLGVLTVAAAMAAGVALAGEKGKDETGEYWQSDDGVKHYYVFWDASTSAYNYNFSWTREDAADKKNTYGSWKNQIDGPIWTFGKGVAWPGSRYVNSFSIYGYHFESREKTSFRLEQDANPAIMSIGAYGIRSDVNDFSFRTYSNTRTVHLAASQTWAGPAATELSASPFYIVPGANDYTSYKAVVTAADDTVLTLEGDMVYASLDYAQTNDLSNADIVIKSPAILALVGFWKNDGWRTSSLKARSITIDGGTGIYFGKRTTNAKGETITMTQKVLSGDSWGRWGALGSAPQLTTNVASTIILKNGATLTAEAQTTVSTGVKIVVPPGETAALKGTFSFSDNLTEIELGEGAFLDISEATITGSGSPIVTGKGTFGPDSARSGTDEKGDWYIGNSLKKSYFLYQGTFTGTRWSMESNSYTRKGARDGSGTQGWVPDSIFTLEKDTSYSGAYNFGSTRIVCGFLHEAPCSVKFEGGQVFQLGSYGIRATSNNKTFAIWSSKANPVLTASQTWTGPEATELSATPFVVNLPHTYNGSYRMAVAAARDDIVLTLAGDMVVSMKTYTNDLSKTDVVIKEPAILSLPYGSSSGYGIGRLKARKLTIDGGAGIYFGKNTDVKLPDLGSGNFTVYGIGSYALISPDQVAPVIELKGDATLTAKEATTVEGGVTIVACAGATAAFAGSFNLADDLTVIRVEAGATLDLTGCTIAGGSVAISGDGTVKINLVNLSAPFTVDPATKVEYVVSGEGHFFLSDEKLALMGGGDILVSSGILMIENAASIPPGSKIMTTAESALLLIDATGFDAESMMGGTKNLVDEVPLVVTEKPRTGTVAVDAGQTLEIWGNGLGESAEVTLGAGATVKFYRTATVGADITSTASATFTTAGGGITGTLAGTYVASSASGASGSGNIWIGTEPGDRLVIDGDWTINANGGISFYMARGEIEVHSTVTCKTSVNFRGGHIKVCDGGEWLLNCDWGAYILNSSIMTEPCCLEAGTNGLVKVVSNNTEMRLGGNLEAKLLISGGTYYHSSDGFQLYKNGVIEMTDGILRTDKDITCNSGTAFDNAKVILSGGTFQCAGNYQNALFRNPTDVAGACTVLIDGNPTLALPWKNLCDVFDGSAPICRWTCTPGSVLRLTGGGNGNSFKMHNFEADGLAFDIQDNKVSAVLPDIAADSIEIGWTLPGATAAGRVVATGTSPALKASYVVPAGATFDAGNIPEDWHSGFASSTLQNLTFEEGSTFLFPYFGSGAALAIGGKLTLPEAANYRVAAQGRKTKVESATILTAADGIDGDCTWTCVGGVKRDRATLEVVDDSLLFSYDPLGALLLIR